MYHYAALGINIFMQVSDARFAGVVRRLFPQVVTLAEVAVLNADVSIGDVLIVEGQAEPWFYDCNAYVLLTSGSESPLQEQQAARMGAAGFIALNAAESQIDKAVQAVSRGDIWMTRAAIANVFAEYAEVIRTEGK